MNREKRYLTGRQIGEGGTADVYSALDVNMGRPVAIKRLRESGEDNSYLAELEALSRITHPNVVCCYDADMDDEGGFIVMEYIEGDDVEALVDEIPFDLPTFFEFARQCLEGLHATHSSGVLHLDLKPSNMMITDLGGSRPVVKLIDFGRAERSQNDRGSQPRGRGMDGSIHYLAPEQLLGGHLDRRTDLYALGCIFYWCLSGKRPFYGDSAMVVMAAHLQHNVQHLGEIKPDLPSWLTEWVMSFLEFNADERPPSAKQALLALQPENWQIGA